MPVKSKHANLLCDLAHFNDELYLLSFHRYLNDDEDQLADEVDLDCFLAMEICKPSQYLCQSQCHRKSFSNWKDYFDDDIFNDNEFREIDKSIH